MKTSLGAAPVTYALIAANIAISLVGFWALRQPKYRRYFVFIPCKAHPARSSLGTVLSHFAHGDGGHLFVNMLALYVFGPHLERSLGPRAYLWIYLVSGVCGTLFVWLVRRNDLRYSALGASGCIAGVVFASIVVHPTTRLILFPLPIPIPGPVFAILYLILSSVKMGGRDGVAHEAHLGGALAGLVLGGLLSVRGFTPLIHVLERLLR